MNKEHSLKKVIAIIGGTGKEGKGLGLRWARAGYEIIIGSRLREKAETAATELRSMAPKDCLIRGLENPDAAGQADIVVLSVPFSAHISTLETIQNQIQGKILVDVTVPLVPPKVTRVQIPPAGSAALEARDFLGAGVEIVSAFQNISYEHLLQDQKVDCDILVSGTSKAAREEVLRLVEDAGLTGWDAGPIENSIVAEGLTSILIGINKQYNTDGAGIKITGVSRTS